MTTSAPPTDKALLFGVFVGGQGRRMGGAAKGLLQSPAGPSIVERTAQLCHSSYPDAQLVLVGEHLAYSALSLPHIPDAPPGIGPLGGLRALLLQGQSADRHVVALACDMPFVSEALLALLVERLQGSAACAPKVADRWEPLCAAYRPEQVLPVVDTLIQHGKHALRGVLDAANAVAIELSPSLLPTLRDWDTPEDLLQR